MKVAFFLPSLRGGGAERVMLNLAKGLLDKGIKVDIVLCRAEGEYLSKTPKEIRVIDLNAKRTLTSMPRLIQYLNREKPNTLISALGHANLVAIWANKLSKSNTQVIVTEHSTMSQVIIDGNKVSMFLLTLFKKIF